MAKVADTINEILARSYRSYDGSYSLSVADTAKLIRFALKKEFPGVKFSVRSESFAGGAAVRVAWTDGPTTQAVEGVAGRFRSRDFDGMIDLSTGIDHWLLPDGTVEIAHHRGTRGSMGYIPEIVNDAPAGTARLVHFGSNYISCDRQISPEFNAAIRQKFESIIGRELPENPREWWGVQVPLKVDRLDGDLHHMIETETDNLSTVAHQYSYTRTGEEVLGS